MPTRDDIRNQVIGDIAVKKSLQQSGDDERAIHTIDHQMLATSEPPLAAVAQVAKLLAFEATPITSVGRPEAPAQFSCYLRCKSTTVFASLVRQSILMMTLAEAYGCTYNGWGTKPVPKIPPGGGPAIE